MRRCRRLVAIAAASSCILLTSGASYASASSQSGLTVTIAVPGPISGCSALQPNPSDASVALQDLILPSAFVSDPNGQPIGTGGAIATAELVSDKPHRVLYSLAPSLAWSNGRQFSASDLINWWQRGRASTSIFRSGYRDITSMKVSADGQTVLATFARPYAPWRDLFRDVRYRSSSNGNCDLSALQREPSLGPYRLVSATPTRAVLVSNPNWSVNFNRIGRVILTTSTSLTSIPSNYAAFVTSVNRFRVNAVAQIPLLRSKFSSNDSIEEIQFAPHRSLVGSSALRRAWSELINRAFLITHLFDNTTLGTSAAQSNLFAAGEPGYPLPIPGQHQGIADCAGCAMKELRRLGFATGASVMQRGKPVALTIVSGPSEIDVATARLIQGQWRRHGVMSTLAVLSSDDAASAVVASNGADAAVVNRSVGNSAYIPAMSFTKDGSQADFGSGAVIPGLRSLASAAMGVFNPETSYAKWLLVDQAIATTSLVRPLFSPPVLDVWSASVENVRPSFSLEGFVDQVTNWGISTTR